MTRKLKAADPTMVEGPSSPGVLPRVCTVSMTLRRISGALEPRAIKVRLAIVGFQTATLVLTNSPVYASCFRTMRLDEVITSMELEKRMLGAKSKLTYFMKMSAIIFIPRNIQKRVTRYRMAKKGRDKVVIPGRRTQLQK